MTFQFVVYNTILRRYPSQAFEKFREGDNLYTTTVHVLVSAIQKLSRTVAMPNEVKLYRGLGGLIDLPGVFWKGDQSGCKGFTEWGFLSTTASKQVAIQYSGADKGRPKAMVLEIETNAVDKGACIRDLSQ